MNALKSGIYSKSLTIPGEDPAKLTTLTEEYFQRYCPALPEQRDLVDILVRSTWTLRRLAVAEAQVYSHQMDQVSVLDKDSPIGHTFCLSDRTLTRLQRIVNSTQRNFRDALREIERLQTHALDIQPTPAPEINPENSAPKPGPTPVPDSQPAKTKPVSQSDEFVSSSSTRPPSAAEKAAPKAPKKPLPFHQPGSNCHYDSIDREKYKRCPFCFPEDCYPDAQE